jgi:hypothetical protein
MSKPSKIPATAAGPPRPATAGRLLLMYMSMQELMNFCFRLGNLALSWWSASASQAPSPWGFSRLAVVALVTPLRHVRLTGSMFFNA